MRKGNYNEMKDKRKRKKQNKGKIYINRLHMKTGRLNKTQ